ncbi:MAG: YdcF family protein [Acidobacteriota bacterium]|nr:YdcF family protein [Acidobacteriota bacterium]
MHAAARYRGSRARSGATLATLTAIGLLAMVGWFVWVFVQIDRTAGQDEARRADAIAVFGAAEYLGHPSPVLHARLDHAVALYRSGMAPLVITLGGGGVKDSGNTEGAVGRDYLLANGVPFTHILAETRSTDTGQQVESLAAIARTQGLKHIIVVSDGTHLFRIREMCVDAGLDVYTSPRPALGHIDTYDLAMRYAHEMLSYTGMRLHLTGGQLERHLAGH